MAEGVRAAQRKRAGDRISDQFLGSYPSRYLRCRVSDMSDQSLGTGRASFNGEDGQGQSRDETSNYRSMDALHRYLTDCENKRRRMRARPSDAVLSDLRRLLDELQDAGQGDDRKPSVGAGAPAPTTSGPPEVGA